MVTDVENGVVGQNGWRDGAGISGYDNRLALKRVTVQFLVRDIREIKRAITGHFPDHDPVTFPAKRDPAIAFYVERYGVLRAIDYSGKLKNSPHFDVGVAMASDNDVILMNIPGKL